MNNELKEHKTSDKIKWWLTLIAFILVGATLAGMLLGYLTPRTRTEEPIKQEQEASVNNGGYETEFVNTEFVRLYSASPMMYSRQTATATKKVYATVMPETATNKKVSWSVKWATENEEPISNYVTVAPETEGSATADITCYSPFEGDVIVTVTTQEGGYTANCIVRYVGLPTEISIETTISNDGETYKLGLGGNYTMNIAPINPFNQLGEDYQNLEVTLFGNGSLTLGTYNFNYGTGQTEGTWDWENVQTVSLDSILDKFITMSYENGVVTLSTGKKELNEEYYEKYTSTDGGRTKYYTNKVKEINTDCSFGLTIKEPTSGLVKVIKLELDKTIVASVNTNEMVLF